jgi:hypothetical protein
METFSRRALVLGKTSLSLFPFSRVNHANSGYKQAKLITCSEINFLFAAEICAFLSADSGRNTKKYLTSTH